MALITLIRGGGDLASGVALRLYRAGLRLIITELPQPLVVRRFVSFAEAVYRGKCQVEGVTAVRASDLDQALQISDGGQIPVLVDPEASSLLELRLRQAPLVLVDARMTKLPPDNTPEFGFIGYRPGSGLCGRSELPCRSSKRTADTSSGRSSGRAPPKRIPACQIPCSTRVVRASCALLSRVSFRLAPKSASMSRPVRLVAEVDGIPVTAPFRRSDTWLDPYWFTGLERLEDRRCRPAR